MEAAIAAADPLPEPAAKLWGHVVDALEAWLDRVEGRTVDASRWWTMASLTEWKRRRIDAHARWMEWAQHLDATELSREVRFTNSVGQPCRDPVEAVVRHLVNHGTHHRGQIASHLRAAGFAPPVLDYIAWRRELREAQR